VEARRIAEEGAEHGGTTDERAGARLFRARLELDLGRCAESLAEAQRAIADAGGNEKPAAAAHALRAVCLAKMGRGAEAEKSAAEAERFFSTLPKAAGEASRLQLQAEMALARGDHAGARRLLEKAASLPPPMTIDLSPQPVEIQFALARAALAAGDAAAARHSLELVLAAGPSRILAPIPYVRSLGLLASLEDKAGRPAEARRLYEQYLRYWKAGDLDRAEVARAGQRLAALSRREAA
jgi:tetratricopeptide (TPR) repeat protein